MNLKRVVPPLLFLAVAIAGAWVGGPVLARRAAARVRTFLGEIEIRQARSIELARLRLTSQESARLVVERMPTVRAFPSAFALLEHSLEVVRPTDGLYCEFGVASGTTINFIAQRVKDTTIHGFDSFEGLPEDWRAGFLKGKFRMGALPEVRSNVELYKGWFDDTLPGFVSQHPGPVAFLHLDADLYSSTATVLDALGDRLTVGGVVQFDEYFNYPGWQDGEFKAFEEFVARSGVEFEYIGYCDGVANSEQVAVRITSVPQQ